MQKLNRFLALFALTTSLHAQTMTIEDHWAQTQITFDQTLYGEINDLSCKKSVTFFVGCMNAFNTALSLTSEKIYLVTLDSSSNDPLPGFKAQILTGEEPDLKTIRENYLSSLVKLFQEQQELGLLSASPFTSAAIFLAPTIKASKNESYFTSLIFNSFLSDAYDPHTYITPRSYIELQGATTKIVKAYGLNYTQINFQGQRKVLILSVAATSPARDAGIEAGDIILDIDGESDAQSMITKINSEESIDLNVMNAKGVRNILLSKGEVKFENLEASLIKDVEGRNYLYLKLTNFLDEKACDHIKSRSLELLESSPEGVILDLRNNGGGRVDVAKCLMALYLEPGSLNWLEKNLSTSKVTASVIKQDHRIFQDLPGVVLINAKSASASEALAMFLQAYRKSYVMGETSFGKGSMQSITAFHADASVLQAKTMAKYYGPHHISPQLQGVRPDIITYPSIRQDKPTPAQRERDLYNNAIINPPKPVPTMSSRMKEVGEIIECLNKKKMNIQEFEALDEFKQRVFDNQLAGATSVLNCTHELKIPIYQGIRIPRADTLD